MLGHIETFFFLLGIYTNAHDELDDSEDDEGEDECESVDSEDAVDLGFPAEVTDTEGCNYESSPDTANAVNGDRADWIVDLDFVEDQDGEHHQDTTDTAGDNR